MTAILDQQANWGWEIIIRQRALNTADAMAEEMHQKLQDATPEELGYPGLTTDELVASEWRCWFEEELWEARKAGLVDREWRCLLPGDAALAARLEGWR